MMRFMLLIAGVGFVLGFPLINGTELANAQTARTDTIRFLASTRGFNYNGTGIQWCVTRTWHEGWPGSGILNALDEVPQTGDCVSVPCAGCPSSDTEQVELVAYGLTNDTLCTLAAPCLSLVSVITSGVYRVEQCSWIEAALFDFKTVDFNPNRRHGDFKGKERMLHATGGSPPVWISAASNGWYPNSKIVGTVANDVTCVTTPLPGQPSVPAWTGYHVHQDFVPPTNWGYCVGDWNSTNFAKGPGYRKQNPDVDWIHSVVHTAGRSCEDPGPKVADDLLDPGTGALDGDGNGGGTKILAQAPPGSKITTAPTCFLGTSWCGTIDITQPLLQGALCVNRGLTPINCFNAWQRRFPPPGAGIAEWYSDGTYYYQVTYSHDYPFGGDFPDRCGVPNPLGSPIYRIRLHSSQSIGAACGSSALFIDFTQEFFNNSYTVTEVQAIFALFRGAGGVNPSVPPTQDEANTWAVTQINTGHWWDVVKPALDTVIRAARNSSDMATIGITGSPSFDGDPGQVGVAAMVNDDRTAFSIKEPSLSTWLQHNMKDDWIRSVRTRWNMATMSFEIDPN